MTSGKIIAIVEDYTIISRVFMKNIRILECQKAFNLLFEEKKRYDTISIYFPRMDYARFDQVKIDKHILKERAIALEKKTLGNFPI
jgi:hypothetical protein